MLAAVSWDTVAAMTVAVLAAAAAVGRIIKWAKDQIIKELRKELRPNGLGTDLAGDILKRTEGAVMAVRTELQQHVEKDDIDKANIWDALHRRRVSWMGRIVVRLNRRWG